MATKKVMAKGIKYKGKWYWNPNLSRFQGRKVKVEETETSTEIRVVYGNMNFRVGRKVYS